MQQGSGGGSGGGGGGDDGGDDGDGGGDQHTSARDQGAIKTSAQRALGGVEQAAATVALQANEPGELRSWVLKGTGRFVLIEPLIVKVDVVLWSLGETLDVEVDGETSASAVESACVEEAAAAAEVVLAATKHEPKFVRNYALARNSPWPCGADDCETIVEISMLAKNGL